MKYKQNYKIMQITESTLVVGVDIAKSRHYARGFDWRGIELDKTISFKSNYNGFEYFIEWAKKVAEKNKKDKIIIGIEPTGHYWYTFGQKINEEGYMLVQVNPYHVKNTKELDDNTPSKSDRKDPKTIAMLMKDGRYQIPYLPKEEYAEIRKANNIREELIKNLGKIKNKIQRWIDTYFPEFMDVFARWDGKTAIITLEEITYPREIERLEAEEILEIWRKKIKRGVGIKKAIKLKKEAKESVGVKEGLIFAKYEIRELIEEYKKQIEKIEKLEEEITKIIIEIPGVEKLLEVKGLGIKTIIGFIAEVGDIKRFEHPKQIIKLSGLNVRENSSGKYKGQTRISKRGRKKLRALLFRAILPITATNKEFNKLHKYYTTRAKNPLKKMQSLIALCHKLIKVMFKIMNSNISYDGNKLLEDIKRNNEIKAA